jgi:hypothetical protein
MKIIGIIGALDYGKPLSSAHSRLNCFLNGRTGESCLGYIGEDYGPPVVNDDDGVKLIVRYL